MKILGLDYGTKRIGVAISDELANFARELKIVPAGEFLEDLPQLLAEHEIGVIVLGLPLNMDGLDTDKTREARRFKETLESLSGLPVEFMDERLSSSMAENLPGGKADTDSLAAQIILQNYLDTKSKN
jgi:putative Holliday junction resolvase